MPAEPLPRAGDMELLGVLSKPGRTHQEQPLEKAFLLIYSGLILQAEENSTTVRTHLRTLPETSHHAHKEMPPPPGHRSHCGAAAARHLDHVWAVLEQFGRSTPVKWRLHSFSPKDETLKQSFLTAILMLVGAVSRNEGTQSYELSQVSELFECLMLLMEKEPQDMLCTSTRQQAIHIISSLCLRSVLSLPQLEVLEKHTCLFLEPRSTQLPSGDHGGPFLGMVLCNKTSEALDQMLQSFIVQNPTADELHFLLLYMYVWLASEKALERQRAPREDFKRIGQLVGMLGILCQDPDKATQCSSLERVGHLYKLLMRHRGEASQVQAPPREKALSKNRVFQPGNSQVIKEIMKHLTMAELPDLIWTAADSLGSTSPFRGQAAADTLLTVIQEHGAKLETVTGLGPLLRTCQDGAGGRGKGPASARRG
ncbi:hypothetical protein J1605_013905 [Eschrichtius robustus]|uniref:Uncharacterized protein n=1 Tax=Eschrichtius robustus TaxID=9764 RepID=A0AB34GH20_ESCRO|nr:hypothetical protein J1605_013905 [Eschrichtius robustus]